MKGIKIILFIFVIFMWDFVLEIKVWYKVAIIYVINIVILVLFVCMCFYWVKLLFAFLGDFKISLFNGII